MSNAADKKPILIKKSSLDKVTTVSSKVETIKEEPKPVFSFKFDSALGMKNNNEDKIKPSSISGILYNIFKLLLKQWTT